MAALVDPNAVSTLLHRTKPAPTMPATDRELMDAYDEDVRQYRATSALDPSQPMSATDIAARVNASFNDARQDAATGPVGYNRQWVPLIQSLKGTRFVGGGSLPTERYADPTHSGQLTLQPATPYDVSTPTVTMPRVTMPNRGPLPMPEDQDAFQARWAAKTAAPTPTTTLKQRATKGRGGPVGRVPASDAITASPSPPGDPFSLDVLRRLAAGGGA